MSNTPLDLNINLSEVDTSMPRLALGDYILRVKEAKVAESSNTPGNNNLVVVFETTEEATGLNGETISPGFQLTNWYPLQQSEKENAPDYRKNIAILLDAVFKVKDPEDRPALTNDLLPQFIGEEVVAKVKLRGSEDDQYGIQNQIGRLTALDA